MPGRGVGRGRKNRDHAISPPSGGLFARGRDFSAASSVVFVGAAGLSIVANTTILMKGPGQGNNPDYFVYPEPPAELTLNTDSIHNIGIKWEVNDDVDDTDFDAVVSVTYKKSSSGTWKNAQPLLRSDWTDTQTPQARYNYFSGSVCFLTPGETYDVRCSWADPGAADAEHDNTYQTQVTTRAIPVEPSGTVWWVDSAATGANNGTSKADAFTTIAAAESAASSGDIIRIADGGTYSRVTLTKSGSSETSRIMYECETKNGSTFRGFSITGCDNLWFSKMKFKWDGDTSTEGRTGIYSTDSDNIVITDCTFGDTTSYATTNHLYPIYGINANVTRWFISDNYFIGREAEGTGDGVTGASSDHKAIQLGGEGSPAGYGHTICYNEMTRFWDGMGVGQHNCDVFGNKSHDHDDDSISIDSTAYNQRIWGNHMYRIGASHISLQPQGGAPWYWMYNQLSDDGNGLFKYRDGDRIILVGNTLSFGRASNGGIQQSHYLLRFFSRNNIWMGGNTWFWYGRYADLNYRPAQWLGDWNTDLDYDAFDYGGTGFCRWFDDNVGDPAPEPLEDFSTVAAFASGIKSKTGDNSKNLYNNSAINFTRANVFTNYTGNEDGNTMWVLDPTDTTILGNGEALDNIADFHGGAPDHGCQQQGETIPIGIRTSEQSTALASRTYFWTKH